MKKLWKKGIVLLLAVSLFLGNSITSLALWNGVSSRGMSYRNHQFVVSTSTDFINVFQLADRGIPRHAAGKLPDGKEGNYIYLYSGGAEGHRRTFLRLCPMS